MAAKPAGKASHVLARKLGPAPLGVWLAAGAVLVWVLFLRGGGTASATGVPVGASTSGSNSGAQVPSSDGGTPADSMSSDLLDALSQQQSSYDALLTALQAGGAGAGGGGTGVVESGGAPGSVAQADAGTTPDPVPVDDITGVVPTSPLGPQGSSGGFSSPNANSGATSTGLGSGASVGAALGAPPPAPRAPAVVSTPALDEARQAVGKGAVAS